MFIYCFFPNFCLDFNRVQLNKIYKKRYFKLIVLIIFKSKLLINFSKILVFKIKLKL